GACGYPGCQTAAEAVAEGKAPPGVCLAGGPDVAKAVGKIMGIEVEEKERGVALVFCKGGLTESPLRAVYQGINSCAAASKISDGGKACDFGCLGLGTCKNACPVNAIIIDPDHRRWINRDRCTGCGICVDVCPRDLIRLVPRSQEVLVVCSNKDKGKVAGKLCSVSCIACKKCEKVCDFNAIHVDDNCAWIDYEKCTQCGKCIEECPNNVIVRVVPPKNYKPVTTAP
ncbi:MAG: RnfABCDGE type electron transport complex subunit B, partial [Actinobacteria bacterium]|nr:RnfABCDGE type electron transport complex subunit B [Actinomycetota bacterium]